MKYDIWINNDIDTRWLKELVVIGELIHLGTNTISIYQIARNCGLTAVTTNRIINEMVSGKYLIVTKNIIKRRFGGKNLCEHCGDLCGTLQRHHIVPKGTGGTDDENNIIFICPNCHVWVHSKNFEFTDLTDLLIKFEEIA